MPPAKRRVLIIDDSPLICSIIKEAVKKHSDFDCITSHEADSVLDKLYEHKPDIVVIDVEIPGLNGFEIVHHIRENKLWEALPIILLAGKSMEAGIAEAYECGADDLIRKPFEPVELVLKIKSILRRMSFTYRLATTELEKKTIIALGRSVEVKDTYTEGHSARVAFYSVIIAKTLLIIDKDISIVEDAAYLHDLGKIGIREEVLNKPGPLTPEEWGIMRTHPEKSASIIESLGFLRDLVPLVKHHHERYDGTGYPDGLKGENIPLGARIISVADSFDAITSNRAFRQKRDLSVAISEINLSSGTQFDPQISKIFISEIKKFPGIEMLQGYTSAESFEMLKSFKS